MSSVVFTFMLKHEIPRCMSYSYGRMRACLMANVFVPKAPCNQNLRTGDLNRIQCDGMTHRSIARKCRIMFGLT